jgi:hypothetical protein
MIDPDPLPPLTDAFLDRIVDGGLTPDQLREALDRLGREPDGWKRCALAFLEAQCWSESFRSMADASPALARGFTPTSRPAPSPSPSSRWATTRTRMAVAAGVAAISFALGWAAHPARTPLAGQGPPLPLASGDRAPVPGVVTTDDLPDAVEGPSGPKLDDSPSPLLAPPIVTVGRVRVSPTEGAPAVPIIGRSGIDEQWVRSQPPTITEHQMALLEQHGYHVDRRRRLVTATLRDGRRVTVPVDRFQVRYTGTEPL